MIKLIRSIILLLAMVSHKAYGQVSDLVQDNTIQYLLSNFDNSTYIANSKAQNIWDLNHAAQGIIVGSNKSNSFLQLPFYGQVRLNSNQKIEALLVEELLESYKDYDAKLLNPIPLSDPQETSSSTGYVVILDVKDLPKSTLDQLPIVPDSVRVILDASYSDSDVRPTEVKLEDRVWQATYFERSIEITRKTEVKIGPFEWESVEDLVPMINWDLNYTLDHIFIHNDEHQLPFVMIEDQGSSYSLAYISSELNNEEQTNAGYPNIQAMPNPAINEVRFVVENMRPGNYKISIKNILGSLLKEGEIDTSKGQSLQMDISMLSKGSYFYSLQDEEGNIISTKRLIIFRP